MINSRKRFPIVLLILVSTLLTSCAQTKVLDKMGLIVITGYDRLKDDRILATSVLHQVDPNAKEKVQVVANTGFTSKGARQAANLETAKKMVSGQIRVTMYSEEIAREGMMELVDTLSRDPSIGTMVYLTIGKGKVHKILSHRYPEISNIGTYLYESIKQNIEGEEMLSPTLHEFLHDYYSMGKDPAIPYIVQHKNEVALQGVALFNKDKMVGLIPAREAFYIKLLRDRFKTGNYELSLNSKALKPFLKQGLNRERIYMVIDNIASGSKIKLVDKSQPAFEAKIEIKARILEISSRLDLSKPNSIKALEKEVNRAFENEAEKVIKKMQKMNSDPVGFGEFYRAFVRDSGLTEEKWDAMYPSAKINVKIHTTILRTGVTE